MVEWCPKGYFHSWTKWDVEKHSGYFSPYPGCHPRDRVFVTDTISKKECRLCGKKVERRERK